MNRFFEVRNQRELDILRKRHRIPNDRWVNMGSYFRNSHIVVRISDHLPINEKYGFNIVESDDYQNTYGAEFIPQSVLTFKEYYSACH